MALSEGSREQLREATRHPVKWVKGSDLPPEKIKPWELAAYIVPQLFAGLRDGFTYATMYLYQNVFGLNKRHQTVANVFYGIFDGINDPLVGAYMDTKNLKLNTHRWITRLSTLVNTLVALFLMFDLGLSAWQRVGLFIAMKSIGDLFGTPAAVSGSKIIVHVTPYSKERSRIAWAQGIGTTIHEMVLPIYMMLIGLRDVFGWSEYSIYLAGAAALSIPCLFLDMAPSFVLQRVPDMVNPKASEETGLKGFYLEMRECFRIVKHNRYFMLDLAARFITVFTPNIGDNDFYRYCGVDEVLNTSSGRLRGEFLLFFRDNIVSAPCNLIVPFALPLIKRLGGPRNTQVVYQGISTTANVLKWVVGMKSKGGILFNWTMEMFSRTLGRVNTIAENINKFEMLDYVEWKTGRRSEGVNMAVDGLMKKIVLNNIDTTVGNLVIDSLGFDPTLEKQPAKFIKWAPTLYLLVPAFDTMIYFFARLLYKYPAGMRDRVEAELIERRKLAHEADQSPEEATV
ncbi:MAG: MFS transporter [Desulfovibrionaceae bacterium]|nr:MFS transporter [Desulfovibrionaceae bacterium]